MKIPNYAGYYCGGGISLARIVSEDSQPVFCGKTERPKSSKDS